MKSKLFENLQIQVSDYNLERALQVAMDRFKYYMTDPQKPSNGPFFKTKDGVRIRFTNRGFREFFYSVYTALGRYPPWEVKAMFKDMHGKDAAASNVMKHGLDKKNKAHRDGDYWVELLATIDYLPQIISKMNFLNYETNSKFSTNDEKNQVEGYSHYSLAVDIGEKEKQRVINVTVEMNDKHQDYYYHFIESKVPIIVCGCFLDPIK